MTKGRWVPASASPIAFTAWYSVSVAPAGSVVNATSWR